MARAPHIAKVTGAKLVISTLERLSRNVAFLLTLRDADERFLASNPTVGIMAPVDEQVHAATCRSTKEAPAAAKAPGVNLASLNAASALRRA